MLSPHNIILGITCFIIAVTSVVFRAFLHAHADNKMHRKILEDVRTRKRAANTIIWQGTAPIACNITTIDNVHHTYIRKTALDSERMGFIGSNNLFYSEDEIINND